MKKLLVVLFLFAAGAHAAVVDSLERLLVTHAADTGKVKVLTRLGWEYAYNDTRKALGYGFSALGLADSLHFEKGRNNAFVLIGVVYDVSSDYDSAVYFYKQSLACSEGLKNQQGIGSALNNLGLTYWNTGRNNTALYYYYNAVKIFEQTRDTTNLANACANIGLLYWELGRLKPAVFFAQKAAVLYGLMHDRHGLEVTFNNMGNILGDMKKHDSSLAYLHRALLIAGEINDRYGMGKVYNDLASNHNKIGQPDSAVYYMKKAVQAEEENNDLQGVVRSSIGVYDLLEIQGRHDEAVRYLVKAEKFSKEDIGFKARSILNLGLAKYYSRKGDYRKAYAYRMAYEQAEDTMMNLESSRQISELQTKYETEKKDLEISNKTLALENTILDLGRKRVQLYVTIGIAVFLLVIGYLFYNRYKLQQKALMSEALLNQQELRNKAIIETEEKERIRIARELHDGVGQHLSAVKMNMSAIEKDIFKTLPQTQDLFISLMGMVDEAVKEVRGISHEMMPNALLRSGLVAAIRDFVNKISSSGLIRIDLQIVGLDERLENTTEAVLYRVLQECVSNIIKHAGAGQVSIQLIKHQDHLNFMVEDNGKGFDPALVNEATGIGLKNIISRVEFLNGTVDFDSAPGRGTTVNITVPVTR